MKLHTVRGGTKEALESRKYNIGVGISLGNKYFTPENILELIQWSLTYTNRHVIVYVADTIHAINLEVRKGIPHEKALAKARKMGRDILGKVKILTENILSQEDLERVYFRTWEDVENEEYTKKKMYLYNQFSQKGEFYRHITSLVKDFTKKEKRSFTDEDIEKLSTYILEELPEVLDQVPIKGLPCEAYVYPYDGPLQDLVEQIQNDILFPEIKKEVITHGKKVVLEVR
jgi:tRNA-dependent cyclodipeptide synthase